MTIRRRLQATFVAACFVVVCAFVETAGATVGSFASVPASRVVGPDPLALTAAAALDAWTLYETLGKWTDQAATAQMETFAEFVRLRDAVAAEAAIRLNIEPKRMQTAWLTADRQHQLAVLFAFTQLGVPYKPLARSAGDGFDCSGITSWAWAQAGLVIPRASRWQMVAAERITQGTAQPGDLVSYPGHVMMYLGVDFAVLHSPGSGSTVHLRNVWPRKIPRLIWGDPLS